jgi:hypothetical protein
MPNRGSAGGQLTVAAGTIAAPSADAALGGAESVAFTGSQYMTANHPASEFRFLHSDMELFFVQVPTQPDAAYRVQFSTAPANNAVSGISLAGSNSLYSLFVTNGLGPPPPLTLSNVLSVVPGSGTYYHVGFSPGFPGFGERETDLSLSTTTAAASLTDPAHTLTIGGDAGGSAIMRFADFLIFDRRLTPYERQIVREYIHGRYGIAAPVWSAEDRQILALNPFSWVRADTYTSAGGKVTAFLDKVLPGHSMAQANASFQVVNPVPDANFNGQLTATLDTSITAKFYQSNLAASAWSFLTSGVGAELRVVHSGGTINGGVLWSTKDGSAVGRGVFMQTSGTQMRLHMANGVAQMIDSVGPPTFSVDAALHTGFSYLEGATPSDWYKFVGSGNVTGTTTAAPDPGAPLGPLTLGAAVSGSFPFDGRWTDLISFNRVLTAAERAIVQAYMLSRYGLAP